MNEGYNNNELIANDNGNSINIPDNGSSPDSNANLSEEFFPNKPRKNKNAILIVIIALLLLSNFNFTGFFSFITNKTIYLEENINDCSSLSLKASNGSIKVKGYDGDNIKLNISYKGRLFLKKNDIEFKFKKDGEVASLDYEKSKISGLSLEAEIPYDKLSSISLSSSNGRIELEDLNILETIIETSNASVYIDQWTGENLFVETSNGKVELTDFLGDKVEVKTSNGAINSKIKDFKENKEYDYIFKTSNGSIQIDLPKTNKVGYKINGKTSNSAINYDLENFITENNSNSKELIGKTSNYEDYNTKVNIEVKTSNASIIID
ncbi:MAG: DUF4097 family beta strand repeat protein [Epulopiscium sp.]|nr:DUF4097 family beta strand repeat protein [Candidatus Epulonipiscium sp.]